MKLFGNRELLPGRSGVTRDQALAFNSEFWHGKRILVTGHTGFKGAWLTLWLNRLGAHVYGISLPPLTSPNLFSLARVENICQSEFCNISDASSLSKLIQLVNPDIVFHLAAQALVRQSYKNPLETYLTNVMGTANLLEGLREAKSTRAVVVVTTDKVYQNKEWVWPYRESDPLGGHDPYSASKAAAEIVVNSYREAFLDAQGIAIASARAGNVIGGGDWSDDRLIPDAIRAWQDCKPLLIRRPDAIRPWQHVLEPIAGYLALASKLFEYPNLGGAYNFGPSTRTLTSVRNVIELAQKQFTGAKVEFSKNTDGPHEAGILSLEVAKAREVLGIKEKWSLNESVCRTIDWYCAQANGEDARILCNSDIASYESNYEAL